MIVNELARAFGLKDTAKGATSLYHVIQHIFKHQKDIKIYIFFTFCLGTIILSYFLIKHPKVPWHAILFLISLMVGFIGSERPVFRLGEAWNSEGNFNKDIKRLVQMRVNEHFKHGEMVLNPYFIINCMVLAAVTILEGSVSMKLSETVLNRRVDKKIEMVGLAITTLISGIVGMLPLSLPIGSNLLALRSGAKHRYYLLIACGLTVFFGWIIWPYMKFLPFITISIFNASLGILLIDVELFTNYWRFNPKYGLIFTVIVFTCFFLDLIFAMIISWIFFLAVYMQVSDDEAYCLGDLSQFKRMAIDYDNKNFITKSKGSSSDKLEGNMYYSDTEDDLDEDKLNLMDSHEDKIKNRKELFNKLLSYGVLYELRGRFNFLFNKTHIANLRHLDKDVVIIDFSLIFLNDCEFIQEYDTFIQCLEKEGYELYITGIPYRRMLNDIFLKGTWVEKYYRKNNLIFLTNY